MLALKELRVVEVLTFVQEGDVVVLHRAQVHVLLEVHLLGGVGGQQALPVETLLWRSDDTEIRRSGERRDQERDVIRRSGDRQDQEIRRETRSGDQERDEIRREEITRDKIRRSGRETRSGDQERDEITRDKIRRETRSGDQER